MALYLCSFKNITRSEGRSAVAAAAYRAGEKVTNRWDGVTHDYTKKQGVVHTEILLPPEAPAEYLFRDKLWNAVEAAEKSTNARLCRECLLALPTELNREQQIALVRDFVEQNFVALGMCADVAIHDPQGRESENPHAHILLTVRPINFCSPYALSTNAASGSRSLRWSTAASAAPRSAASPPPNFGTPPMRAGKRNTNTRPAEEKSGSRCRRRKRRA